MNWLSKIKGILGNFWSLAFSGQDFLLGVENSETLVSSRSQGAHDAWAAGMVAAVTGGEP